MAEEKAKSSSNSFKVGDEVQYRGRDLNGNEGNFVGQVTDVGENGIAVTQNDGSSKLYQSGDLKRV